MLSMLGLLNNASWDIVESIKDKGVTGQEEHYHHRTGENSFFNKMPGLAKKQGQHKENR